MIDNQIIELANQKFNHLPKKTSWLKKIEAQKDWYEDYTEDSQESDLYEKIEEGLTSNDSYDYWHSGGLASWTMPREAESPEEEGRRPQASYFLESYGVTDLEYKRFENATAGISDSSLILLKQIVACYMARLDDNRWVPIPYYSIRDNTTDGSWKELLSAGLIDAPSRYSRVQHVCREFKPADWLLDMVFDSDEIGSFLEGQKVNLFTGKRLKVPKSKLYDHNKNKEPDVIYKAVRAIEKWGCLFDKVRVIEYISDTKGSKTHRNDLACYRSIDVRKPEYRGQMWWYSPSYNVASTGRIFHVGGGFQSCSRGMKSAGLSEVDGMKNWDLKGSQVAAAILEFEVARLDPSWLVSYSSNPNAKFEYASSVGVSERCWKDMLLSLLMGAKLPRNIEDIGGKPPAILRRLNEEFDGDTVLMSEALQRFRNAVSPLHRQLKLWHKWLLEVHVEDVKKYGRGGAYIQNRCGKRLWLDELKMNPRWKQISHLTAFLLQGVESAYIHHLTILGDKYGYQVTSNQHDGLTTIGYIPHPARDEAKRLSGFAYAELEEEKGF